MCCPFLSCNPSLAGAHRNDEVEADTCLSFPNCPLRSPKCNYQIMPENTTASLAIRVMAQKGHQPSQHLLLQVPGHEPHPKASASHRHWQNSTQNSPSSNQSGCSGFQAMEITNCRYCKDQVLREGWWACTNGLSAPHTSCSPGEMLWPGLFPTEPLIKITKLVHPFLRSLLFPAILYLPSTEFLLRREAVSCLHGSSALSNLLSQFLMGFVYKSPILRNVPAVTGRMEHPHQAPKNPARSGQGCSGSCPMVLAPCWSCIWECSAGDGAPEIPCSTCSLGSAARSGYIQLQLL